MGGKRRLVTIAVIIVSSEQAEVIAIRGINIKYVGFIGSFNYADPVKPGGIVALNRLVSVGIVKDDIDNSVVSVARVIWCSKVGKPYFTVIYEISANGKSVNIVIGAGSNFTIGSNFHISQYGDCTVNAGTITIYHKSSLPDNQVAIYSHFQIRVGSKCDCNIG